MKRVTEERCGWGGGKDQEMVEGMREDERKEKIGEGELSGS